MNTYYMYSDIAGFVKESNDKLDLLRFAAVKQQCGHRIKIYENVATEENLIYDTTVDFSEIRLKLNELKNMAMVKHLG